ncbi:MAG: hypothetical protein GXO50_03020, partial [Chlorobi bacterium]|nr:hypothetical protein [Chlorobiota bacterium]
MKIKQGDKVKFLNDVGGGTVTEIIDSYTAKVLTDTGFEIPYLIEELMPDYSSEQYNAPVQNSVIDSMKTEKEEEPVYTNSVETNIFAAFVPDNISRLDYSD